MNTEKQNFLYDLNQAFVDVQNVHKINWHDFFRNNPGLAQKIALYAQDQGEPDLAGKVASWCVLHGALLVDQPSVAGNHSKPSSAPAGFFNLGDKAVKSLNLQAHNTPLGVMFFAAHPELQSHSTKEFAHVTSLPRAKRSSLLSADDSLIQSARIGSLKPSDASLFA
jgi:hypothetical protein